MHEPQVFAPTTPALSEWRRYAVYWAPRPEHPLWKAGSAWLGRDPREPSGPTNPAGGARTAIPALYGFHATLKAPIHLAAGVTLDGLLDAVRATAQRHRRFRMPPLGVDWLGRFLCLQSTAALAASHPLCALARDCVTALDVFRRPADAAELARRRERGLNPEEELRLLRWGYPQVLDGWRFHMTLSDACFDPDAAQAQALRQAACAHFGSALEAPLWCDRLWVYEQAARGAPFQARWHYALADGG